ncbi:MAG: putative toxin-antitoxin system toxin component, PIN family [Verrucomicrobia bacterium]|nr:putative toxin-antitoxin system toxin component, PIN family [Verrucomicrobiota bacterium]
MKVILDTNVLVSGIFFSGVPYDILTAWRDGKVNLIVSPEILEEYRRVGEEMENKFPGVEVAPFLELLAIEATMVAAKPLIEAVCTDPDDDKFLACAIASKAKLICSGDKALLKTTGYRGIEVLTPRSFADRFLGK